MNIDSEERIVFFLPDHGIKRCLQFGYYKYSKVQPQLPMHQHANVIEICFCIKGKQHYIVGDELFQLHGNDILIIPPDKQHSTGDFPEDKGELFWLQIICSNPEIQLCNLPNDQSDYLLEELIKVSNRVFKGAFQVKFMLEKLMGELKLRDSVLSIININQLIIQVLLEVVSLSGVKQESTPLKKLTAIDKYIVNNMYRIIYVDELAEISNISVGYFKAWFKKRVGIPPKEYVNRLKVEQAKIDLLKKDTITTVAFDLGFSSSQYFSTTFKKYTGHTPKSYISSKKHI